MRGGFIVIEGIDRSGKSTQTRKLHSLIQNSMTMAFPNRETVIASTINAYLTSSVTVDDRAIHLLFSANRWECIKRIKENIEAGNFVIVDRYAYSGVAYSAAKGMDLEWCKASDAGLISPDIVFYMKMAPDQAKSRSEYGEERYEKIDFQKKVAEQYEKILVGLENCVEVDANQPEDDITNLLVSYIQGIDLSKPLKTLW
jgi:dTMP kinase